MSSPHVLYLSGAMTGIPEHNYPAFNKKAGELRDKGYEVLNPAENFGGDPNHPGGRPAYMREDIVNLLKADAVVVMSKPYDWHNSKGANAEIILGKELGLPILDADTLEPIKEETVAQEAERIVGGDRGPQYGHPTKNFDQTAALWNGYLEGRGVIEPRDVAMMMILLKIARNANRPKRDNIVDVIGYAKTAAMVEGWE